jgi:D-glycero-D-manno-heptose 1,7-bisphosphate phosphatase
MKVAMKPAMKPACFLDRDGVVVDDVGYLSDPADLRFLGDAAQAIRRLNVAGVPAVLITNQAGIARGFLDESRLADIHARLEAMLAERGARIDGIYYCPHHPTAGRGEYRVECDCRKPNPGMLRAAAADLDLDLAGSFFVGDKLSDLGAGHHAGCRTILVRTGYGREIEDAAIAASGYRPAFTARDISDAVDFCLRSWGHPSAEE